jgi:LmbE family N-acetylglucosaminyl deacetylase
MTSYVFFQAHPDDLELNCPCLMHHLASKAHNSVRIASLTKGEWGLSGSEFDKFKGEFLADVRTRELYQAAAIHDISPDSIDFLGFVDGFVRLNQKLLSSLCSYLNKIKPDIIVAPEGFFTWYYHKDHVNLVRALYYILSKKLIHFSPTLYFYTSLCPNCYFPIHSDDLHLVDKLIKCHKTQFWLLKWMKYLIKPTAWFSGLKVKGWKYAEPYRQVTFTDESKENGDARLLVKQFAAFLSRTNLFDAQYPFLIKNEMNSNPSLYIDISNLAYWSQRLSAIKY